MDDDKESADGEKPAVPGWLTWDVMWPRASYAVPWALAMAIAIHEVWFADKFEPTVIPLIGLFVGLPFAYKQDRLNRGSESGQ